MTISTPLSRVLGVFFGVAALSVAVSAARVNDPAQVKQLKETRQCVGCDLREAFLDGANLVGADAKGADFRGASLYLAVLINADLKDATFVDANLIGANLRGAKGANLTGARTSARTTCPDGTSGPCL